jgi:hypothetical protein
MPNLFQDIGQRGKDPRGEKSQLVEDVEYAIQTLEPVRRSENKMCEIEIRNNEPK